MLSIALSTLSACSSYQPQLLAPAAQLKLFEARSLESPELLRYDTTLADRADARPEQAWNLDTLTRAAFYFSPELDVARAQADVSQAAIQTAGQRPNPTLEIPLGYTTNPKDGESPYTFGLGLDIPIETAGKRGYRVARAQQLSRAARFQVGSVAWQIRSRLRTQLLDLYAATRKEDILRQQVAAQQQIEEMLDKRLSLGAVSSLESNQAGVALLKTRISLENARKDARDRRALIAKTIGVPVSEVANIPISFDAFEQVYPEIPADAARRVAILNRADLMVALSNYEASQAALQQEIARQFPDIHLGPGYTFDKGEHTFGFSISGISLPIFNQNKGPIAEATAKRREMAARVASVQAQAIDDTDRALTNYRAAMEQLRRAESLLAKQEKLWRSAQDTFKTGETDRLALELAQAALDADRLVHQDALVQLQRDIGALEDALQRPLSTTGLQALPDPMETTH